MNDPWEVTFLGCTSTFGSHNVFTNGADCFLNNSQFYCEIFSPFPASVIEQQDLLPTSSLYLSNNCFYNCSFPSFPLLRGPNITVIENSTTCSVGGTAQRNSTNSNTAQTLIQTTTTLNQLIETLRVSNYSTYALSRTQDFNSKYLQHH